MNVAAGFADTASQRIIGTDPWIGFASPASAQDFIESWFSVLLSEVPQAKTAILLLEHQSGGFAQACAWPDADIDGTGLRALAQKAALDPGRSLVDVSDDGGRLIGYPVAVDGVVHAIIALSTGAMTGKAIDQALRRLHWGAGWLHSLVLKQREIDAESARKKAAAALEIIAAIEDEDGLEAALRALANELLVRLRCERVSIAMMGRRRLALQAISETSDADSRTRDMRQLRQALEEARLQGRTLVFPAPADDTVSILAAHRAHARRAGTSSMISAPLRLGGELLGVVGVERMQADGETGGAFRADEIALLEAILASVAPVLRFKKRAHRIVSGRGPELLARGWTTVFGRGHPVLKLALSAAAAGLVALAITPVPLTFDARAVVVGTIQRAVTAPFDGYVASAPLRAGDVVAEGDVLATLDDADLRLGLINWQGELAKLSQERRQLLATGDRVGVALANARAASAQAELDLVQSRLARIRLVAPFDGLIVEGDLTQRLGAPVSEGEVLFEISRGNTHKAMLHVSEYDVALVEQGAPGRLALMGLSGEPIPIRLANTSPVAELGSNRNIFLAEAELPADLVGLRPGLEGTAKIEAGETTLLMALIRPLAMRMRYILWQWTP